MGSFGLLWFGRSSLAFLIIGIVVLDIGTQGMQITNQAIIYALRPDARSRINSAYMVCYFVGGAVGSVTAGVVYSARGWAGVCLLGAFFGLLTCALTLYERVRPPVTGPGAGAAVRAGDGAGAASEARPAGEARAVTEAS
jgi:predicted MFS family arabinose efflux permease